MDIWQVLVIGIRRWRITVPLAIIGIAGAWIYSSGVAPTYKADGSLLYLPPAATVIYPSNAEAIAKAESQPGGPPSSVVIVQSNNPFASGSLRSVVLAAQLHISSNQVARQFHDLGLSTNYSATTDRRNAVLYLSAQASSAQVATATLDELVSVAFDDLQKRQDQFNIDQRERVTAQTVTKDNIATVDLGGRVRVRAILLLLAILFALGGGVLVEGFLDHRAGRRPFAGDGRRHDPPIGDSLTIHIPDNVFRERGAVTALPEPSADRDDDPTDRVGAFSDDDQGIASNGKGSGNRTDRTVDAGESKRAPADRA